MSLRDRFPEAFTNPKPDWLPGVDEVCDDDLVEVARQSLHDACVDAGFQ